jgi:hypothetical protein
VQRLSLEVIHFCHVEEGHSLHATGLTAVPNG